MSNAQLLHETESRSITSIIRQCLLWLCGYVARYPETDSACASCRELLGMGRETAWRLERIDHNGRGGNTPLDVWPP